MGWSEIDRTNALWTLPASRSKNHKPHQVPLAPAALAILDAIPQRVGRDLIFGSADGGFKGYGANKLTLDKAMAASMKDALPWRVHDIRRTVATGMGDLGGAAARRGSRLGPSIGQQGRCRRHLQPISLRQ